MIYETRDFNDLVNKMASCDNLGLYYIVQKVFSEETRWFSDQTKEVPYWKLQVIEYTEGVEEDET